MTPLGLIMYNSGYILVQNYACTQQPIHTQNEIVLILEVPLDREKNL